MHTWNYAYRAARKGEWEMYARDRERFKLRIQRVALTLNPILDREHRQKIYEKRFVNLYDNDDNNNNNTNDNNNDDNNNNNGPLTLKTCQDNHNVTMANELKETIKSEENPSNNTNNIESKKPHQKKKRKKRRFVKMGNKHYF